MTQIRSPFFRGALAVAAGALLLACGGTSKQETPAAAAKPETTSVAPTPKAGPSSAAAKTSAVPATAVMPNVVKKNAAIAQDELEKLGFTRIQFGSQDAEDKVVLLASNWTVTKQSTAPGQQVPIDTLIVLTCTKKA